MARASTTTSYHERMNRVLLHIHQNLDEPLTIDRLAEVACLSPFHFHRIFTAHAGETVSGHVRRLRLERAAMRIAFTGDSITDTALEVGYETPAAFARAFRERFSISPSEFREERRTTIPPFAGNLTKKEMKAMKPERRNADVRHRPRRPGHYGGRQDPL